MCIITQHIPNNNDITISDIRVSNFNSSPIHVIARDSGTVPPPPFALRFNTTVGGPSVETLPFVAADGSGVPNDTRAQFSSAINYTPLSTEINNQRRLWVVPTAVDNSGTLELDPNAQQILATIQSIESKINTSVVGFLAAHGVSFATQHSTGAGDLTVEIFANRRWCDYFAEAFLGVMFPTGTKINDPGLLLRQVTGNNGHYVFQLGGYFGWNRWDWLGIKVDAMYQYAAPATEHVAAAFTGATIKNIGPTVDARISWQSFVADLDVTFMVPCNPSLGIDLGYEFYTKGQDRVSFDQTEAVDFFGVTHTLDASVIAERTKIISNKARVEVFYRDDNWELFAGWMHAFAGKNALKETDVHLGFIVYF